MPKKIIVTNLAYGTGPYLRMTGLALAFNDELEKHGEARMGVIVPLIYGERQKTVMAQEFSQHYKKYPGEIIFDEELGQMLRSIFYGNNTYEEALGKWVRECRAVSKKAHDYLVAKYRDKIVVELNRSPRIRYDVAPSYFTSFAYIGEILEKVLSESYEQISTDKTLVGEGIEIANWVESRQKIHATAYPATFSWKEDYKPRYATEILTPPIVMMPRPNFEKMDKGFFVTVTGIPGLERLYHEARTLGYKLYSNDTQAVFGSSLALPRVIPNQNTIFQFARSGWSSVWTSMISGTPFLAPDFDPKDDPEIYFNNIAIEKLGIGAIFRGEPLSEILAKTDYLKKKDKALCNKILARWGTLDGNKYCAKLFVDDYKQRN